MVVHSAPSFTSPLADPRHGDLPEAVGREAPGPSESGGQSGPSLRVSLGADALEPREVLAIDLLLIFPSESGESGDEAFVADDRQSGIVGETMRGRDESEARWDAGRAVEGSRTQPLVRPSGQFFELAARLTGDYQRIETISREAEDRSARALEAVRDVARRVEALQEDHGVARPEEERLAALTALADEVTRHAAALERQHEILNHQMAAFEEQKAAMERTSAELRRVAEAVADIESRRVGVEAGEEVIAGAAAMVEWLEHLAHDAKLRPPQTDIRESVNASVEAGIGWGKWTRHLSGLVPGRPHPFVPRRGLAAVAVLLLGMVALAMSWPSREVPQAVALATAADGAPPRVALLASRDVIDPWVMLEDLSVKARRRMQIPAAPRIADVRAPVKAARAPLPPVESGETTYFGTLRIESDPAGAAVLVDQRAVGQTPVELTGSRAGSHTVWIERAGYQRWTAAVPVTADTITRITAKLQPESGR